MCDCCSKCENYKEVKYTCLDCKFHAVVTRTQLEDGHNMYCKLFKALSSSNKICQDFEKK